MKGGKSLEQQVQSKRNYITGIDGLRTLAVIGVILYHLLPTKFPGGYLGVPVFFVLSGYLITDLLRQEWQQFGKINLVRFYVRRLKRLYPALVSLLLLATTYITLFQREFLYQIKGVITSSLLSYNNWWQIKHQLSYFEQMGHESAFTHLWSLAVEGQFYLVWPIVLFIVVRFIPRKTYQFYLLSVATVASILAMAILFTPGSDPSRVYYGTDTRLFSILLGCILAFYWPSQRLKKEIPDSASRILNYLGFGALVVILASFVTLDARYTFVYYGGMALISLATVVLLAAIAHPASRWNRWMTNPVFTYLGKRSYGIYLYQFPVMIFYEAKVKNIADHMWWHIAIEIALILLISEGSYRWIEEPLRKRTWQASAIFSIKTRRQKLIKGGIALCVMLSIVGMWLAPKSALTKEQQQLQATISKNKKLAEETKKQTVKEQSTEKDLAEEQMETGRLTEEQLKEFAPVMKKYQLSTEEFEQAYNLEVTAIGDSVMLGCAEELQEVFPKIIIDAEVGRQLYDALPPIEELKQQGLLKEIVIVGLGTNGLANTVQVEQMLDALRDHDVYLVNVYVPTRRWQNAVNKLLESQTEKYKNVTLIDWFDQADNEKDWFTTDHIHPEEAGQIGYTRLVAQTILQNQ